MRELASIQEQNASFHQRIATLNRELTSCRQQLAKAQMAIKKLSQQKSDDVQRSLTTQRQRYAQLHEKYLLVTDKLEEHLKEASDNPTKLKMVSQLHFNFI